MLICLFAICYLQMRMLPIIAAAGMLWSVLCFEPGTYSVMTSTAAAKTLVTSPIILPFVLLQRYRECQGMDQERLAASEERAIRWVSKRPGKSCI